MRMEEPRRWKSVGRVVVNSGFGWVGIKRGKGYLGGICSRNSFAPSGISLRCFCSPRFVSRWMVRIKGVSAQRRNKETTLTVKDRNREWTKLPTDGEEKWR